VSRCEQKELNELIVPGWEGILRRVTGWSMMMPIMERH